MALPVYLDVDTGIDDALAILLAVCHPALDVRGITTVAGNVDLDRVTRNTLRVLDIADGQAIPVVRGAEKPLVGSAAPATLVHGEDGLGGAPLPPPGRQPDGDDAVAFLREELMRVETPVTLIPLGPLTNIALLLSNAPEVKPKIKEIVLMGGAIGPGNETPAAEFNIWHDPEAANNVFHSGLPVLMYGLDVFREVRFTREEVESLFEAHGVPVGTAAGARSHRLSGLVAYLLRFMMRNFGRDYATIGDAGCVASVIDRAGLTTEALPAGVETSGRYTRGQTVVDRRPPSNVERVEHYELPTIEVATGIDSQFYRDLFMTTIFEA